jgi:hypothetical protein
VYSDRFTPKITPPRTLGARVRHLLKCRGAKAIAIVIWGDTTRPDLVRAEGNVPAGHNRRAQGLLIKALNGLGAANGEGESGSCLRNRTLLQTPGSQTLHTLTPPPCPSPHQPKNATNTGGRLALDNIFNIAAVLFMWCMIPAFGAAAFVPSLVLGARPPAASTPPPLQTASVRDFARYPDLRCSSNSSHCSSRAANPTAAVPPAAKSTRLVLHPPLIAGC